MNTTPLRYTAQPLGQLLAAQGRKQSWLAKKVGVSTSTISLAISGERTVSEDVAKRIADAIQIPLFLAFEVPIGTSKVTNDMEVAS